MATTIQSGRANSPLLTADVASRAEVYGGRGLVFDGVSDALDIERDFAGAFSISFWIKPHDVTDSGKGVFGISPQDSHYIRQFSQSLAIRINSAGSTYGTGNVLANNVWTFLVITRDDSNVLKWYVNGEYIGSSATQSGTFQTDYIGRSASAYFDGAMCDVKYYDVALSESDITSQYLKPESVPSPSTLVAWYPMSEGNPDSPQSIVYDHSEKKLGSDIITNGDYSNGTTGWSIGAGGTTDTSSGALLYTYSGSGNNFVKQEGITAVNGALYKAVFTVTESGGSAYYGYWDGTNLSSSVITLDAGQKTYTQYFTATSTSITIRFVCGSSNGNSITVDNVSVKEVLMGQNATTNFFEEQFTNGDMASEPTINGQNITHSNSSHIRQAGPLGGQSWIMTVTNGSGGGDSYLKVKPLDSSLIGATMNISIKLYKVSAFSSLQVRYIKEDTNPVNIGSAITANDTWTTVTGTVPADATGSSNFQPINVVASGGSTGSQYYVDEISVKVVGISSTGFSTAQNEPTIPQIPLVKYNEKMLFDGSNDIVATSENSPISGSNSFTMSAWIIPFVDVPDTSNDYMTFIKQGSSSTNQMACFSILRVSNVNYLGFLVHGNDMYSNHVVPNNTWSHVVITYSSGTYASGLKIYFNGMVNSSLTARYADVGGTTNATPNIASSVIEIGKSQDSNSAYWNGIVDELSYFNTALSSTEVQELFNDGVALDATTHSKFIDTTDLLGGSYDFTNATQWNQISNANRTSATSITATSDNGSIRTTNGSFESDTRLYKISIQGSVTTGNITLKSWGGQETWKTGITGTFNETVYATTSYGGLMIILTANTAVATITSLKIERQYCAGYWRNDGVTTWTDRSGVGNTGNVAGTPDSITIREGLNSNKDGLGFPLKNADSNVLRLNGNIGEYIEIPPSLGLFEEHTLEAWFKTTSGTSGIGGEATIISYISNGGGDDDSVMSVSSNKLTWSDFVDDNQSGTSVVNDNKWYHGVVVVTGTKQYIYVDGTLETTTTNTYNIGTTPTHVAIGARANSPSRYFDGLIDEVRIYNKALSLAEIQKNYKHGKGKHKND